MADLSSVGEVAKSIGDLIAGFVPEGPLRTAVMVVYGLCGTAVYFTYKYYLGVLAQGAKEKARLSGRTMTSCGRASPVAISRSSSMRNG